VAHLLPVGLGDAPGPQVAGLDARLGREQALGELEVAHLEREEEDGAVRLQRHRAGRAQCEGGLARARPRRDDHEVRGLQPEQHRVEVVVPGRHAGDVGVAVHALELVEGGLQRVGDRDQRRALAPLRDLEHERLGPVEGVGHVVGRVVAHLGDVAGDEDQPAQQRELVDDPRVVPGIGRRGRAGLDAQERGLATDGVEQVGAAQLLRDRHRVGRLTRAVQREDRLVDVRVRGLVVVGGLDADLDRGRDRVARQQHRAQEGLLGLDVVRRNAPAARRPPPRVVDDLDQDRPLRGGFLPRTCSEWFTASLRGCYATAGSASSRPRPVDRK
jgi:hypothetical protein